MNAALDPARAGLGETVSAEMWASGRDLGLDRALLLVDDWLGRLATT